MKRLVLLCVIPLAIWAQPEFFGYFESEMDILQLGAKKYTFGYTKFRLDVEARPNDHVLIGANMNAQQYWGKTTWNVYDFIPGYNNSPLTMNILLADTLLLDNVYMKIIFPRLDMTLGRQQISPGVGYAWNPTDIFNHKSLMDPSYEQPGVDVVKLSIPLASRSSLGLIIQPGETFKSSTQQYSIHSGFDRFDFGFLLARQFAGNSSSAILGEPFVVERDLYGGSLVGEVLGWGVWVEYAHNSLDKNYPTYSSLGVPQDFSEYLAGADHTFDNSLYLLAEYLHNGYGVKDADNLGLYDYLNSLIGETHTLMQDYGFLYIMHPTFDYITLSALALINFNDKSGTLAPQLDWNSFENTTLSVQSSLSWGADDTEFGLQDWGLRLRLLSNF